MSIESITAKLKQNKKAVIIVVAVLAVLFVALPLSIEGLKDTTPNRALAFQTRLSTTAAFANKQKKYINNSRLENENANMILILQGAASTIGTYAKTSYQGAVADPAIATKNANNLASIETSLSQSRLSNTYELTYRQLMILEMESMQRESLALSKQSGSKGRVMYQELASQIKAAHDGFSTLEKN